MTLETLRRTAGDAVLDHYLDTHGIVGEHDHHCPQRILDDGLPGKADPEACTCGWSKAELAIDAYMVEEVKHATDTPSGP